MPKTWPVRQSANLPARDGQKKCIPNRSTRWSHYSNNIDTNKQLTPGMQDTRPMTDGRRNKDCEGRASVTPGSPKGRGGPLQCQGQITPEKPSRIVNAIPAGMEGNHHQQINLLNQMQRQNQPLEKPEEPMEHPKSTKQAQSSSKGQKGQAPKYKPHQS